MTQALLALALGATVWNDPSGRVHCNVPDEFRPAGEGRFALGNERIVMVPFVPASSVPQAELPTRLLASVGLPPSGPDSLVSTGPSLAGAVMTLPAADGSAAVAALGLPGDAFLVGHLAMVASSCQILPPAPVVPAAATLPVPARQVIANGRIFDSAFRVAVPLPPDGQPFEYKGSGAVSGSGWQIFLIAPGADAVSLEERAKSLLSEAGATPTLPPSASMLGRFRGAIASGAFMKEGRQFFAEAASLDAAGAVVGVVLISEAASQFHAQEIFLGMLQGATPAQ